MRTYAKPAFEKVEVVQNDAIAAWTLDTMDDSCITALDATSGVPTTI